MCINLSSFYLQCVLFADGAQPGFYKAPVEALIVRPQLKEPEVAPGALDVAAHVAGLLLPGDPVLDPGG